MQQYLETTTTTADEADQPQTFTSRNNLLRPVPAVTSEMRGRKTTQTEADG